MNLYVTWVIFCILSASFLFGIRKEKIEANRQYNIDGLRYILAAFVVFHHNGYSENLFKIGVWRPSDNVLTYAGTFGVAVFFMITGYLFGEMKKESNWPAFFIKRFFRIVPMCYLSSICCIIIAAYIGMQGGWKSNYVDLVYWFDGGTSGMRPALFGFKHTNLINAGVTWTLYWEWIFYFSLPLFAFLFNRTYTIGICIASIAILINTASFFKIPLFNLSLLLFFAIGILIRNLKSRFDFRFSILIKNAIALLILIYCMFYSEKQTAYNVISAVFIGVFFFMIATGGTLFGFLTCRGTVLLGDASYSLYLIHGVAWFVMNKVLFHYGINDKHITYYAIQTIIWYAMCYVSIKTYIHIEKPFIAYGKKVASYIK